ncbi:unnamed protein product [Candida verbasci]|uniref:Homeobox domain-containing protein n=1 Tax=Candida verbasci TaxID=1227364 RepID=A0A9W4TYY9_9ASCO|nr:unnamed protein product [Candida verbasci]
MIHLQTPKRPLYPPLTPSTNNNNAKYSLPPLSSVLSSSASQSNYIKDHPLNNRSSSFSTPYRSLPSIDSITSTPIDTSYNYNFGHNSSTSSLPSSTTSSHSTQQHTPTSISSSKNVDYSLDEADTSIIESRKSKSNNSSSIKLESVDKAYAFISHSPATFPSQEPSIDNAPLARRKRRRTSIQELNILNKEFKLGTTPNKMRRFEIAKKVSMTEKAVQIWFQNKRQSLRKHSNCEKEITLLPEAPPILDQQIQTLSVLPQQLPMPMPVTQPQQLQLEKPVLISSTPTKPIINKSLSFVGSPQYQQPQPSIPLPRSYSIPVFKPMPAKSTTPPYPKELESTTMIQTNKKQPQSLNGDSSSTMTFKLIPSKITQKLQQAITSDKKYAPNTSPTSINTSTTSSVRKPLGDVTNKIQLPTIKK